MTRKTHSCGNRSPLLKNIKYLRCTWHRADSMTTSILRVNGAENIFIYADRRPGNLLPGQCTRWTWDCHLCSRWKHQCGLAVIQEAAAAAGRATWQSITRCTPALGVRSSFLCAHRWLRQCADPEPRHIKTKLQCAYSWEMQKAQDWVNVSGQGEVFAYRRMMYGLVLCHLFPQAIT